MPINNYLQGSLTGENSLGGMLNTPSALSVSLGVKPAPTIRSYERLTDLPQVNGVTLIGDKTTADLRMVFSGTVAQWNESIGFIPPEGSIIIYSDYATSENNNIPNYKIGDGLAYLVDLPFVDDNVRALLNGHIADSAAHVSASDRAAWDGKVRCTISSVIDGDYNLVFTTE